MAATVDVPVTGDRAAERDETFGLRLTQPVNVWLAADSAGPRSSTEAERRP